VAKKREKYNSESAIEDDQMTFVLGSAGEKFMSVMVCKTIHEICPKRVQRIRKMKFLWKEGRPINPNKVCTSSNAVQMDDSQTPAAIGLMFWFYHPQPCIFIWFSSNCRVPMNESAWVVDISKRKRKQKKNTTDYHASHPRELWINVDKYSIVTRCRSSPYWGGMNTFLIHSTSTTEVTGCIKSSHS
jgi:hypothetical protein